MRFGVIVNEYLEIRKNQLMSTHQIQELIGSLTYIAFREEQTI